MDDFSDLRISYIPKLFERTEERRQRLMKNYYFLCECPKCLDVIGDQTKSSIKCPGKNWVYAKFSSENLNMAFLFFFLLYLDICVNVSLDFDEIHN